jgi:5-methylcytosine-specific restriction enzyme subunit McrC
MIPIQNIYYLLLYAWDALEQIDTQVVAAEPETQVLDLLAVVLNHGIDRVLRQGLHRAYLSRQEAIPGVRGKFNLSATVKADLLRRYRTVCEFDELSHDVLHNRILKATLRDLLRTNGLDVRLREPLRATWHRLHEIAEIPLTERTFRRVQFHRSNSLYRFLLDVCRLLHQYLIPNERTGQFTFRNFLRDKKRMRVLFERFIRNFFRRHAVGYVVEAEPIRWQDATGSAQDLALLPGMRTDVSLRCPGLVLVIDAKYYRETLQAYRGRATIRSGHLYQLFAYLKNIALKTEHDTEVEGLLIYPLTTLPIELSVRIQGHRVRVYTLNLNQDWPQIHADLLGLLPIMPSPSPAATAQRQSTREAEERPNEKRNDEP